MRGRTRSAAPSWTAAPGIPQMTLLASSWAMVSQPASAEGQEARGAVAAHAGQEDRDARPGPALGHAPEEDVDRRAVMHLGRLGHVAEPPRLVEDHVVVGRRQQDLARQGLGRPARSARRDGRSARRASGPVPGRRPRQRAGRSPWSSRGISGIRARISARAAGPPVDEPITTRGHHGIDLGPRSRQGIDRLVDRGDPRRPADELGDGLDLGEQESGRRRARPRGPAPGCRRRRAPPGPSPRRPRPCGRSPSW